MIFLCNLCIFLVIICWVWFSDVVGDVVSEGLFVCFDFLYDLLILMLFFFWFLIVFLIVFVYVLFGFSVLICFWKLVFIFESCFNFLLVLVLLIWYFIFFVFKILKLLDVSFWKVLYLVNFDIDFFLRWLWLDWSCLKFDLSVLRLDVKEIIVLFLELIKFFKFVIFCMSNWIVVFIFIVLILFRFDIYEEFLFLLKILLI